MQIKIMNRKEIEECATKPFEPLTALISCRDFGTEPVQLKHKPAAILWLEFDDVSLSEFADFDGTMPSDRELARLKRKYHVFTEAYAKRVEIFYKASANKVNTLICQCEHGESRSAAIAAAIKQHTYQNGIDIFADEKYLPNKTVYKMVYEALEKNSK